MVDFDYARPRSSPKRWPLLAANPEARAAGRRPDADPDAQAAAGAAQRCWWTCRPSPKLRGIEVGDGFVTVGAMTRHAETATHPGLSRGDPGAGLPGRRHRPSAGAACRHHGRIDQQQRPGSRLSRRAAGPRRAGPDHAPHHRCRRFLHRPVHAPRWSRASWWCACASRGRCARATARSPTPPRVMSPPAASSPTSAAAGCAWPSTAPAPACSASAALEAALAADFSPAALAGFRQDPQGLNADLHASAAYRAQLVGGGGPPRAGHGAVRIPITGEFSRMKLMSYVTPQRASFGVVHGERVDRHGPAPGRQLPRPEAARSRMACCRASRRWPTTHRPTSGWTRWSSLPVIPNPGNDHLRRPELRGAPRRRQPQDRRPPRRPSSCALPESQVGHGRPLRLPARVDQFDFEAELAVVIGKAGRRIAEGERAVAHRRHQLPTTTARCATGSC